MENRDLTSPDAIMGIARAFHESRVLLTAAQLDLFTHLSAGERTAEELAAALPADTRALRFLLDALVALGLLRKQAGRYENVPAAQEYLVRGAPNSVLAAVEHSANVWDRWHTLTEVVRTGRPVQFPEINERGPGWIESFLGAMDVFSRDHAPQVASAIGIAGVRRMLDVGGGPATYDITFARQEPGLTAVVFDLPNAVPIAERNIAAAGLQSRITTQAGDFRTDDLGTGFDLVLVSAIIHMNSPEQNEALLRKCFAALTPGGRVVIQDFVMDEDRTTPAPGAFFALNMLVGTEGGGTYTESEVRSWLDRAGFVDTRRVRLPGPNSLMIASRP